MADGGIKRSAFAVCFAVGLLLTLLSAAASVVWSITRTELFRTGLREHVDYNALGIGADELDAFAEETIAYLRGTMPDWNPKLGSGNAEIDVSDDFTAHMATVKKGVNVIKGVVLACFAVTLTLLARAVAFKGQGFSLRGYYLGALSAWLLLGAMVAWACLDFNSMWAWIHRTFIPDGIFDSAEPIMRLFPVGLFQAYLAPVGVAFGALAAVSLSLPVLIIPLAGWVKRSHQNKMSGE